MVQRANRPSPTTFSGAPRVRCTAIALGYNICLGTIGGVTPLAATWLVQRTGNEITPALLVMAAAAVTFATVLTFRETYRAPFAVGRVERANHASISSSAPSVA